MAAFCEKLAICRLILQSKTFLKEKNMAEYIENNNIIQIQTGLVEFKLNGIVSVIFNPTDATFLERIASTFDELTETQKKHEEKIKASETTEELFAVTKETDEAMRLKIADLFGTDVVTPLIGTANVYMLAGGAPFWVNLLEAITDKMDEKFTAEKEASKARMKKYTQKYSAGKAKK